MRIRHRLAVNVTSWTDGFRVGYTNSPYASLGLVAALMGSTANMLQQPAAFDQEPINEGVRAAISEAAMNRVNVANARIAARIAGKSVLGRARVRTGATLPAASPAARL